MPHIHKRIDFAVDVLIVHKNKVLLRKHDKYKIWLAVGGHIELDEDPNQAAIREVKEEVNLEIEKPEYLLDLTFVTPDGTPVLVLSYFAKYESGEVILDEDSTEYAWVTLAESRTYDLIGGIVEELEMVHRILEARK